MDALLVVVLALVLGGFHVYLTSYPLLSLAAIIVGAIVANRRGYRHRASAMKMELTPTWPSHSARTVEQESVRLIELYERLVSRG